MRFDKFTVKAQEAVVRAQELAQQRDHAEVLPLHLLAALPVVGEGEVVASVEEIQDEVERALMAAGAFAVARRYIVYREARARRREEQALRLFDADGQEILLNLALLRSWIAEACAGAAASAGAEASAGTPAEASAVSVVVLTSSIAITRRISALFPTPRPAHPPRRAYYTCRSSPCMWM